MTESEAEGNLVGEGVRVVGIFGEDCSGWSLSIVNWQLLIRFCTGRDAGDEPFPHDREDIEGIQKRNADHERFRSDADLR